MSNEDTTYGTKCPPQILGGSANYLGGNVSHVLIKGVCREKS